MKAALLVLVVFAAGCAHQPPIPLEPINRVMLPASVPGSAHFCVEDPSLPDFDQPQRHAGWYCGLSVDDIRRWVNRQQPAE